MQMVDPLMAIAITLHVLSAVLWVGGMLFAYAIVRPAAGAALEPPARLKLWTGIFERFFPWVWLSIAVLLATGYWMIFAFLGGFVGAGMHVHIMQGLGIAMMLLFAHVYFGPYPKLKHAVAAEDWPRGGEQLDRIRRTVAINTVLGFLVIAIGAGGRFW